MREDFINSLICHDCKVNLDIKEVYTKTDRELINAIVRCDCCEYPLLDGILIYKKTTFHGGMSSTAYLLERLKIGRTDDARALPLKGGRIEQSLEDLHGFLSSLGAFKRTLYPILALIRRRKKQMYGTISRELSFMDIMSIIEPGTWGDYLKHRFSSQTFWSVYPVIPLIEKKSDSVLDLGCGAGHASFILSKYVKPENLVCTDENYTLLFLARRFMAKNAHFICLDANSPLPFMDNFFSSILMMDSAHYVSNRALLGKECERILQQQGLLSMLHLHNALQDNISTGFALSPTAWKGLVKELNTVVIPEGLLIEDFMQRYELDLTKKHGDDTINSSNAISIIGTTDDGLVDKYDGLNRYLEANMPNPMVNPIYELEHRDKQVVLKRKPPNDLFIEEYPLTMRFLPKKYSVPPEISKAITGRMVGKLDETVHNKDLLRDMIRRFIIIDAPIGYL